jgi:hypothetical protein
MGAEKIDAKTQKNNKPKIDNFIIPIKEITKLETNNIETKFKSFLGN